MEMNMMPSFEEYFRLQGASLPGKTGIYVAKPVLIGAAIAIFVLGVVILIQQLNNRRLHQTILNMHNFKVPEKA
jgi:hypothetical protein